MEKIEVADALKSQGRTFDRAHYETSKAVHSESVHVALSRKPGDHATALIKKA